MSKNNRENNRLENDQVKQGARDMLHLANVQTAQMALNDAAVFLRNNYTVYTAGVTAIVRASLDGNEKAHASFALLNSMLAESEKHFENMVENTNKLMGAGKASPKD